MRSVETRLTLTSLPAASPVINNYDKVYDPIKARAKQLPSKLRHRRDRDYDSDDYDDYDRHGSRRHRPRGGYDYYDEKYERREGDRAKSAGRDGYGGRGLRDDRSRRGEYSASWKDVIRV